ncbi:MAG: MerR family transcriptional regulator [Caulobacteraceae bacterium]|nr:MerR family transcriptional regulator [Caulobacteraceae bacterium]
MRPNDLKISSSYLIGELCAHFSLSPRALRFYEEKGLITPRRGAQKTRHYSRADFNRVQVISWGRRAALSLEEIRELLNDYDSADQGRTQAQKALAKLKDKAARLDAQRAHIAAEIERIETHLDQLDAATEDRGAPMRRAVGAN